MRNRAPTKFRFCSLFKRFDRDTYTDLPTSDKATACTVLNSQIKFVTDKQIERVIYVNKSMPLNDWPKNWD